MANVLLVGLTNPVTEMARHLVLSGVNIQLVQTEKGEVAEGENQDEFLLEPSDLGK